MTPTLIRVSSATCDRVYSVTSQKLLELILRRDRPERVYILGCARTADTTVSVLEVDQVWRRRLAEALRQADMVVVDSRLTPSYGEYVLRFDCMPAVR